MNNEIILYQPNETIKLEVRLENESVWLTQQQMAELFETTKQNVSLHINNAFKEGELDPDVVVKDFLTTTQHGAIPGKMQRKRVAIYNLDVIISVGYRVKSLRGTQFRQWANKVLKQYLLKGYAVTNRIERLEGDMHEVKKEMNELRLSIKTSLPPSEGLFFNGQIYDAFECVRGIIKTAKKSILLIDNYVDETVLTMMANKEAGVTVTIYTSKISQPLQLAEAKFNAQYSGLTLKTTATFHDRFLIIDDEKIYLIGASLKDLGRKWFGFTEMDASNIARIKSGL